MIGDHTVQLIPDPDVLAWGPVLASNPTFDTDLAGWGEYFGWTWAAGEAVAPIQAGPTRGWELTRNASSPVPRDAATAYRVRSVITVPAATPLVVGIYLGTTPAAASLGPTWYPNDSIQLRTWLAASTAGTFTIEGTFSTIGVDPRYVYLGPFSGAWPMDRPFPGSPRVSSITLQGQGSVAEDMSCLIDRVTIRHGREDADSQPAAASATLDLTLDTDVAGLPDSLEIGGIIRITTRLVDADSPRFVGRVTDIATGWIDAGPDTPNRITAQIIAVGMLADLGRRIVGDAPFPQELDGARVARIMSLAGVTLDPAFSDPGVVEILPRDIDSRAALEVAHATADSANGVLWHTRSGEVRYADAEHRRGATPVLNLDACDVLVTPTWTRSTEGLLNLVSIGYGVAPEGGEQPRHVASRPDSVERYGRYELSTATELATATDAAAMGSLLLTRNSSPVWVLSELPVDVKNLDAADTSALLSLDIHSLVRLTGLPAAGSAPTSAALWVEGWTETLAWGEHALTLTVSGYCRTAPPPRWDDVDPDQTWDTFDLAETWDDMSCLGPVGSQGRWADVPASLRWDQTDPAISWDEWEG
jgi:hypothetical protein